MIRPFIHRTVLCPWPEKIIQRIVARSARFEPAIQGAVEITIIGDKRMRTLNRIHRQIDRPTDVLSFGWNDTKAVPSTMLGQIYLDYPLIIRQAKRFKVTALEEGTRMLVHGLLHLVGYDHGHQSEAKTMFTLQEKIVAALK